MHLLKVKVVNYTIITSIDFYLNHAIKGISGFPALTSVFSFLLSLPSITPVTPFKEPSSCAVLNSTPAAEVTVSVSFFLFLLRLARLARLLRLLPTGVSWREDRWKPLREVPSLLEATERKKKKK